MGDFGCFGLASPRTSGAIVEDVTSHDAHTRDSGQQIADPVRITRHADVVAAATNPVAFSSAVSRFLNVPNTMDGEEHTKYRAIVDRYLTSDIVRGLEPMFCEVAAQVSADLVPDGAFEAVRDYGFRFAVRAQCRWLGWPQSLERELLDWMDANHSAARSGDAKALAEVAQRFTDIVSTQVEVRAQARATDPDRPPQDVTEELFLEQVDGGELTTAEIVSILRNWTAGDLSSLALCTAVVLRRLAISPDLQRRVRYLVRRGAHLHQGRLQAEFDAIIDECIRIEDPFVSNRRVTTCPVSLPSGHELPAGHRVVLDWAEANRDPEVFGNPDDFRPDANRPHNLVYGIGPHVCPGRELSTSELRIAVGELLAATPWLELAPGHTPVLQEPPLGGYAEVRMAVTQEPGQE